MVDIALELTGTAADLVLEAGDIKLDHGLRTAVLVSLFTDRRAADDEGGAQDRRGYWADTEADRWGSFLWRLPREKVTAETLNQAREYGFQALEWLIEDGIAEEVVVEAERVADGSVGLRVEIVRGAAQLWPQLWSAEIERFDVPGASVKLLPA